MNLTAALRKRYTEEQLTAREAQRLAEFIAWGPAVFQAQRLMLKWGILDMLRDADEGLTREEICDSLRFTVYGLRVTGLRISRITVPTVVVDNK